MRKTALATIPCQTGRTPFSNYVIKPDETGVTGAIVKQLQQLACAPFEGFSPGLKVFSATVGFRSPFLAGLARDLGFSPHLELQNYSNAV